MALNETVQKVTERVRERSHPLRSAYMERMARRRSEGPYRANMSCGNMAHLSAGCRVEGDKQEIAYGQAGNIGIINAYNDMLSAHAPYDSYPAIIKDAARKSGGTAQVAAGVPAMCDGVTQGRPGMDLSLFSRDVIALASAVGLSHDSFDAALFLGICDKIVPGMVIAAATFGHLPAVFVPGGPMPTGIPNDEKSRVRQQYASGKVGREELLDAEMRSYHAPGTCTFYGTANTNQMLMEIMGLHIAGATYVNPDTPLREAFTRTATKRALEITALTNDYTPVAEVLDEKAFVNGMVGLNATGGSTNNTLHLVAMARAAGIVITWEDMFELSEVTPLMTRVYPNGVADVNDFRDAGGLQFLIGELLEAGLVHPDTRTVMGQGLAAYTKAAKMDEAGELHWEDEPRESANRNILRPHSDPFQPKGGLKFLKGNVGAAVIKISAVKSENLLVDAPARVFHGQADVRKAFEAGELNRDCVCVVRFQGAQACGMPELHSLTPQLSVLQDKGYKVALVTDGRMSGASGRVPAAIHVSPEAAKGGNIAKIRDGDRIRLDCLAGTLEVMEEDFESRAPVEIDLSENEYGVGRELFGTFRNVVSRSEDGATVFSNLVGNV